ncbi:hypothetical protein [Pinirhizobacter sp.]|jgi:hypothetical protein|uniref:hypothetical protein n=1 Tax=Pinirhizobacter sp. TaxID=2950432 RepID=UPI002F3EBAF5
MKIEGSTAAPDVLRPAVSFEDAKWDSIEYLLDEADTWLARGGEPRLLGLSDPRITEVWSKVSPDHEPPPGLLAFLHRAGADAPFMSPYLEHSYRLEHYEDNLRSARIFVGSLSSNDNPTDLHCLDEKGALRASIVIIACDIIGETYYCMDVSNKDSPIYQLYTENCELMESSHTMLGFLGLELINYWAKQDWPEG